MKYSDIRSAIFKSRPNRFTALCEIDGKEETVHVKNTGRLKELLISGRSVYLQKSTNPHRKTAYDLIAVKADNSGYEEIINIDSQVPNDVAAEWLKQSYIFSQNAVIKREVRYGSSRFDFFIQDGKRKAFIEVKGVTLKKDTVAMFPDAPTERGVKHINELIKSVGDGYEAYILFILQMKGVSVLIPNSQAHKEFSETLKAAAAAGVKILALDCIVTSDSITADKPVKATVSVE